jgi:Fe-S cluster biogenesis protein NfuA
MEKTPIEISLEFTPNPNTLKYELNRPLLLTGPEFFRSREEALPYSPLAVRLFDLGGIVAVMIGSAFVTVTLAELDSLREMNRRIMTSIKDHLEAGQPICQPRDAAEKGGNDPISQQIRQILDEEIRPAVARDGGDITFEGFDEGTVYLFMKGACAGCPSSTATLKLGIETRLKALIPEVKEVVPIA